MTSNSDKIKPVALAIIELCLSEGIRQSVSQSVSRTFRLIISKKNCSTELVERILG